MIFLCHDETGSIQLIRGNENNAKKRKRNHPYHVSCDFRGFTWGIKSLGYASFSVGDCMGGDVSHCELANDVMDGT